MVRGTAKFDGIALGEFSVNFLGPTLKMSAKAAFVGTESGATYGWTSNEQWSPETIAKLRDLQTAMEADLARIHFGATAETQQSAAPYIGQVPPVGGLGEHLGEGDGRSI
jgi:hypothetical protein